MRTGLCERYASHADVGTPDKSDKHILYIFAGDGNLYEKDYLGVSTKVGGSPSWVAIGPIDCSGNPDYPASNGGDALRVTVAGRIGGVAGPKVQVDDLVVCWTTNGGGDQAAVGADFSIEQDNLDIATVADYPADNTKYTTAKVVSDIIELVESKTIVQMQVLQGLGTLKPFQMYAITNVVFGGLPNPIYYTRAAKDGVTLESGYVQDLAGGVKYPADYDLATDWFLSLYDPQYNCRISRTLGGAKTCVDNWLVGNVLFKNVGGHEFDLTTTGAASILNCAIAPQSSIGLLLGSTMSNIRVDAGGVIALDKTSHISDGSVGASAEVDAIVGSQVRDFDIAPHGTIDVASAGSAQRITVGETSSFVINGGASWNNTIGSGTWCEGQNGATINGTKVGNSSTLTVVGPAGIGAVASVSNTTVGNGGFLIIGNNGGSNTHLLNSIIGDSVSLQLDVAGAGSTIFNGCTIGASKSISISDGVSYNNMSWVGNVSTFQSTLDVTTGLLLKVFYNTLVGVVTVGDTVTDTITGATGIVVSDFGGIPSYVIISTITGFFGNGNALTFVGGAGATAVCNAVPQSADGAVTVGYNTLANGPYVFGQVLTISAGGPNALTGTIISDDGSLLILKDVLLPNAKTGPYLKIDVDQDPGAYVGRGTTVGGAITKSVVTGITFTTLTLPVAYSFIGVYDIVDSNTSEAVGTIVNLPITHNVEFRVGTAVVFSIPSQVVATAGADNIATSVPFGLVANGSNGDSFVLRNTGDAFHRQVGVASNYL